jgi:hypothetical protein
MKALFEKIPIIRPDPSLHDQIRRFRLAARHSSKTNNLECTGNSAQSQGRLLQYSGRNFRQDVHPLDLGRHSKLLAQSGFYAHDPGMAAYPALLSRGQFRRQHQHQLHLSSLADARIGVQKDPVRTHVTRLSAQLHIRASASHAHGQPRRDPCT